MHKRLAFSIITGIVLSGAMLYFAFRNVPFDDLRHYLMSINYWWVLPGVAIILASFFLRAFRWQILLNSERIRFWQALHPLMIGFMLNCVFPGRIGEIVRPLLIKKKEAYPFTRGLATVAAERLLDTILLVCLLAVVLATVPIDPGHSMHFGSYSLNRRTLVAASHGLLKICLLLIAVVVLVSVRASRRLLMAMLDRIPTLLAFGGQAFSLRIERMISRPLKAMVEHVAGGFAVLRRPGMMLACVLLSVVIWLLVALSYFVILQGAPGIRLSFAEITAVMVIVCFFIALPSIPGYWGIWEAGGVFAMTLFGVSAKEAAGFTLANHAVQLFPIIVAGLISALITGVNLWQVALKPDPGEMPAGI